MNPFDFVKSINEKTENLMDRDPECERAYLPFIVNRTFSNFAECVMPANIMNCMNHLDKKMQYDYLYYAIKKKKRFSKWEKSERDEIIEKLVSDYYKVSRVKAREYLSMMSENDKDELIAKTNTGGRK